MSHLKSYRTKPTVEEGIAHRIDFNGGSYVEYQPGDGRVYRLVFTQLSTDVTKVLGAQPRSCLVTLVNFGCSMVVALDHGYLAASYVAEKMPTLSKGGAATVVEFIAHMTGRQADGPAEI